MRAPPLSGRALRRWGGRDAASPLLVLAALAVTAAALLPLAFVAATAIEIGPARVAALVFRARVGELLLDTGLLVGFSVPLCAVLALVLAWLTERSDLPGSSLWAGLATAPLAIPAFVQGYAWSSMAPGFDGLPTAVLLSTLAYFPLLYLPVAAALRRLDPALEEAAATLGQTPLQVFLRVVLPQLRLAFCGGGLLVSLHLLGEYGLYAMIRFDTFTTAIVDQFTSTFEGPAANMLAGVLALCCLVLLLAEGRIRGAERYARVGTGAPRPIPRVRLGAWAPVGVAGCGVVATASVGVPLVMLGRWLAKGGTGVWRLDVIGPSIVETAVLSIAGGLLTTLAAVPIAWLSVRSPSRLTRTMEGFGYMVGSLPGAVLALGLVAFTIRLAPALYQTSLTLIFAYGIMFLPRALVALRASIAQAPVELERAAASLGRPPLGALASVTLRLASPGVAAAMMLVALGIANELTATQMLSPNGTRTLATAFWARSQELDYAGAAPYGLAVTLLSLPLVLVLHRQSRHVGNR